jgi:hypothetical protein
MWTFRRKLASGDEPPAQRALSFLAPDEVEALGQLPFQAILGVYDGPDDSVESFRPNRAFVELLQRVVEEMGMRAPELAHGAQDQREGWLHVIDPRTPMGPDGRGGRRTSSGRSKCATANSWTDRTSLTTNTGS